MADKYDAELDSILNNAFNNVPVQPGQTLGKAVEENLKAKLSALLRRAEIEAKLEELRATWDIVDTIYDIGDTHKAMETLQDKIRQLEALLPRSPQEGTTDA